MLNKLVSVVITTHERNDRIVKRAIDSVVNQTYDNWELFVVDDSPSSFENRKRIAELVDSYQDAKINYISLEKNMGACYARNEGIRLSKGEYICFLDDDDVWVKEKLTKQVNRFEYTHDNKIALVYCGAKYYDERKDKYVDHKNVYKKGYLFDDLIVKNFIGGASFPMIKNKVLKELGGFDVELLSAQDLDMWLRIAKKYKIDYVDEPLVIYYKHSGEQISKMPHKRIQGMQKKIDKNIDYLEKHPKQYSMCILDLAFATAMGGNIHEAFALRKKANKIYKVGIIDKSIQRLRIIKHYLLYRNKV